MGCENNKDKPKNETSKPESKTYIEAVEFFEEKNYYVETMTIAEFWGDDSLEGSAFVAFDKTNVDNEEYCDWDGDAMYQTKNIIYALYFENESGAQAVYSNAKALVAELNLDLNDVEAAGDYDGYITKEFVLEIHDNIIYIGTQNAIDMAR